MICPETGVLHISTRGLTGAIVKAMAVGLRNKDMEYLVEKERSLCQQEKGGALALYAKR